MLPLPTLLASIGGAIALGTVFASAIPTTMKSAPQPEWKHRYEHVRTTPAASNFRFVENGPIDLSPDLPAPGMYRHDQPGLASDQTFERAWRDSEQSMDTELADTMQNPLPNPALDKPWSVPAARTVPKLAPQLLAEPGTYGTLRLETPPAENRLTVIQAARQASAPDSSASAGLAAEDSSVAASQTAGAASADAETKLHKQVKAIIRRAPLTRGIY